jgi:redox-sensitive bicupin YhaK (pirin superfamily)
LTSSSPPWLHECMTHPSIQTVITPRTRDLGDGFTVRRALPSQQHGMVGPFIFFDQMGPVTLPPGHGLDVRPHPHIGLATITYLYEGEILHRDSVGSVQPIRPGEVNWMTAGRGIAHSERTAPEHRVSGSGIFGIQVWVALPKQHEEVEPSFVHHKAHELPSMDEGDVSVHLIAGTLFGARSPVPTLSEMFYADATLKAGATLGMPKEHEERGVFVTHGAIEVGGDRYEPGQMLVFGSKQDVAIRAPEAARVLLFGGEPMESSRYIWWNFVSSSKDRIAQAQEDWRAKRFPGVPDETEFIPLPEGSPGPVSYP